MKPLLRPLDPLRHRGFVHEILTSPANDGRYRGYSSTSPISALDGLLVGDDILMQSLLMKEDEPLGFVQCLVPNFRHGTAQLAVALASSIQQEGWPILGVVAFVGRAFFMHPIRKLYLEIPGSTTNP